jgi:hypothetical protein
VVKIATETELLLRLVNTAEPAQRWENRIPFDDPTLWKDYLSRGVKSGQYKCARIEHNGVEKGIAVFAIDQCAKREFVVVAVYCDPIPGVDVTAYVGRMAFDLAKAEKCTSVRFHTMRPGLIMKAQKLGYRVAEVVLRKEL